MTAFLANGLQNVYTRAKVAHVENGQFEVYETEMANASGQLLPASLALFVLLAGSLTKMRNKLPASVIKIANFDE